MINIRELRKSFGTTPVFDDVSLDIQDGTFTTLLGPSGCGKSTLISMIAGLTNADSGFMEVGGRAVTEPHPSRQLIFQRPTLMPWLSVESNVGFGLKNIGINGHEAKTLVRDSLRSVHMWHSRAAYPHTLSGGMQQRVALARALSMKPRVLLMDEPFSALDEQTRLLLQDELQRLWMAHRMTVVFVTHSIREAIRLSDRIVVLGIRPGRIVADLAVELSRPRMHSDPVFFQPEERIFGVLSKEIEKLAKQELGDDYVLETDTGSGRVYHTMGSGI